MRVNQHLGSAVAVGGDRVLSVGGPGNVYVFGKNAQGGWSQTAKLVAPDGGALTGPIAFDGTHALVRGYNSSQTSVVYHFQYDAGRWRALAILRGAQGFGRAIAMEGCTALISSSIEEMGHYAGSQPSFVHFFDRCRTGQWTYINSFATPSGAGPSFGWSVALSGTNALVGAPAAPSGGRVYQYVRTGDTWALKETFQEQGVQHGQFGKTVAISSDLAIVAGHYYAGDSQGHGQIFRFSVSGNNLTNLGRFAPFWAFDWWGYADFGEKVVITPGYVFVSAPARRQFIDWSDGSSTSGTYTPFSWVVALPRQGANGLGGTVRLGSYDHSNLPPPEWDIPLPYYTDIRYGSDIAASGSTLVVGSDMFRVPGKAKIEEGRVYAYDIP